MAGRWSRGWAMARESYAVLKRHPSLLVFPAISGAALLVVFAAIAVSLLPQAGSMYDATHGIWDKLGTDGSGNIWFYVGAYIAIYVLTVIAVFFNVALVHCALRCHAGQEPSVGDGIAAAMSCLPQILGWALVATTVGIVLNAIESFLKDKLGFLGSLIGGLFEFGWAVVTYFVIPVLVTERVGPIAAIRRSSAILRAKWGESLAGEARFGLVGLVFYLQAAVLFFIGLAIFLSYGPTAMAGLGPLLIVLGVVYAVATSVVLAALSTIFQAGVYIYATTGAVPPSLDRDLVESAFRPKKG
jgi:Family of unknown function (DUF6159)